MPGATIKILNRDSNMVTGALTGEDGSFSIPVTSGGEYIVVFSSISYKSQYKNVSATGSTIEIGKIALRDDAQTLSEVEVKTIQNRGQQKGDTTQFNADAFKVNPDANAEDLVKKMPGITSDNEGMKVNGEKVQKILVDGKPFFGDDPNAALKNLPAEIIDKVEVFDRMSDQAQFTGFDDGGEQKTINIVTKKGKNIGQFGRVYAGAGADENSETRYNAGAAINSFNDKQKVTLLLLSNNVNQQNFSLSDVSGGVASSGAQGRGATRRNGSMTSPTQDGISTTHAAGLNYSDMWGKKLEVSGSYFFNYSDNRKSSVITRNIFSDDNLVYREANTDQLVNRNHRINLRLDYSIDSNNKLTFVPALNLQDNSSRNLLIGNNSHFDNVFLSSTRSAAESDNYQYNFTGSLLYQHKFRKRGRTISLNVQNQQNEKDIDGRYNSLNEYIDSSDINSNLDQLYTTYGLSRKLGANLAYTEPLNKYSQLQVNYQPSYTENNSTKITNDYDHSLNEYNDFNPNLSNKYNNVYTTQRAGMSYRYRKENVNLSFGADAQESQLAGEQEFPYNYHLSQSFRNILPNARFNYRISKSRNLRINYRSSTNIPDVSQLQEVVDISNPLQVRTGNFGLKQTFEHSIFARYGGFDAVTSKNIMLFANVSATGNYISNATYILQRDSLIQGFLVRAGSQLTKPVNLDGYYNGRLYFVYGFPFTGIKSNLNFNGGVNYNRTPALVNDVLNYSNSYATNAGLFVGSNINKDLDFSVGYNINYTIVKNTAQTQSDNSFINQSTSAKLNWIFLEGFVLNTDVTHTSYLGLNQAFNQNYVLWNAAIGYKFLKGRALEARVSVFDLLNQNRSIGRTVTGLYTEDYQTVALRRYGMFSLIYTFRHFKSGGMPDAPKNEDEQGMRPERGNR